MKIAIFISGNISQGLDSATPGEGRYGQNLAKVLASEKHEVDCICNSPWDPPSWGGSPVWPGVRLMGLPDPNVEYDIALYVPWEHQLNDRSGPMEPCTTLPMRSKWYVHFSFGWGPSIAEHPCHKENHVLAYPYLQWGNQFPKDERNPFPTFFLPMPTHNVVEELDFDNRKDIFWTCKDVFHPDWGSSDHPCPRIGLATLRAIKKLSQKFDFGVHFLSTKYFCSGFSKIAKEMDVLGLVSTIPNVYLYDLVSNDFLVDRFKKTRITTLVSGLTGSFNESVPCGAIPLSYNGCLWQNAAKKCGVLLDRDNATEYEIYDFMERIYTDDALYTELITGYREELKYHHYWYVYEFFKKMVKELGLEIE